MTSTYIEESQFALIHGFSLQAAPDVHYSTGSLQVLGYWIVVTITIMQF